MSTLNQCEARIAIVSLVGDDESEVVITAAGSYYLSQNMNISKACAIHIKSPNVHVDLNGFEITRSGESNGDGIRIDGEMNGCAIRNGSISGFKFGINSLRTPALAEGCIIEDISVSGCGRGIYAGISSRILNCRVYGNSSVGLTANNGSILTSCIAEKNQSTGIIVTHDSIIKSCVSNENQGLGFCIYSGSVVRDCSANKNTKNGIYAGKKCAIENCTVIENGQSGIVSGGSDSSLNNCSAIENERDGIRVADRSTVKNCSSLRNLGNGVSVRSDCYLVDNLCDGNGYNAAGSGFLVSGSKNRIDNNMLMYNKFGLHIADGTGNFIIRNSASSNGTNFQIAAGNAVGAIVASPMSDAVSGDTGGSGVGTTDPWANFSF